MTPAHADPARHRAPALWLVVTGIVGSAAIAWFIDARTAATVLTGVLLAAALARLVGGDRRPEGIAVRGVWVDVVVLVLLAAGIGALLLTPGVA